MHFFISFVKKDFSESLSISGNWGFYLIVIKHSEQQKLLWIKPLTNKLKVCAVHLFIKQHVIWGQTGSFLLWKCIISLLQALTTSRTFHRGEQHKAQGGFTALLRGPVLFATEGALSFYVFISQLDLKQQPYSDFKATAEGHFISVSTRHRPLQPSIDISQCRLSCWPIWSQNVFE